MRWVNRNSSARSRLGPAVWFPRSVRLGPARRPGCAGDAGSSAPAPAISSLKLQTRRPLLRREADRLALAGVQWPGVKPVSGSSRAQAGPSEARRPGGLSGKRPGLPALALALAGAQMFLSVLESRPGLALPPERTRLLSEIGNQFCRPGSIREYIRGEIILGNIFIH